MSKEEQAAVIKAMNSVAFQNLIGAEEWDLNEEEECLLWEVILRNGGVA